MTQIASPKGILLDLDNTLYDYKSCHKEGLNAASELFLRETRVDRERFSELYNICRHEINRELNGLASSHNRLLYFQRVIEKTKLGVKARLTLDLYNVYWDVFIRNIRLYDGVFDFLKKCCEKGVKIALVTDLTADVQMKKIAILGLDNYIDAVVTSEEARLEKPLMPIFRLALKKIGVAAQEVWVIGDSMEKDIVGGNSIGATTILFDKEGIGILSGDENDKPMFIVKSFPEIIDMLNKVHHRK